jgi:chemotaxis protein methyltransferase CheR
MTELMSHTQLQRLNDFVAHRFGLYFPEARWSDLQRAVSAAARESASKCSLDRYVDELLSSPRRHTKALASHLTVGETYFFREPRSLEILEKTLMPELIRRHKNRAIRIWSAGCATGEEPYSIAIPISKLTAGLENCSVEILATDLNTKSLQKAVEGIYGEWSFRGTPPWVRSDYFEAAGKDLWAISPAIKQMVSFAKFNLMDDSLPPHSTHESSFDVIFCRNVLMYFTPEARKIVVQLLYRFLASDGWLVVSPSETAHDLFAEFSPTDFGGVTFYRKSLPVPRKTSALTSVAFGANDPGSSLFDRRFENSESALPQPSKAAEPDRDRSTRLQDIEAQSTPYGQPQTLAELERHSDLQQTLGTLASQGGNNNDAHSMFLLARSQADQGNLAAALAWCDKAIAADKMAARAYYLRATILLEQGFLSDAAVALKQTVYVEPHFVLGHFCLGNLALNQGRLKESEKHFENVLLILARYQPEDVVPESDGISAGRLGEIIISRRGDIPRFIPEADATPSEFAWGGKPHAEQTRIR